MSNKPELTKTFAESVKPTRKQRALESIEYWYKEEPLTSPKFRAFADHIDQLEARVELGGSSDPAKLMKLCLIEETIRQRINEIPQYRYYFTHVLQVDSLREALAAEGLDRKRIEVKALGFYLA